MQVGADHGAIGLLLPVGARHVHTGSASVHVDITPGPGNVGLITKADCGLMEFLLGLATPQQGSLNVQLLSTLCPSEDNYRLLSGVCWLLIDRLLLAAQVGACQACVVLG